jgi:hypothetical protein
MESSLKKSLSGLAVCFRVLGGIIQRSLMLDAKVFPSPIIAAHPGEFTHDTKGNLALAIELKGDGLPCALFAFLR